MEKANLGTVGREARARDVCMSNIGYAAVDTPDEFNSFRLPEECDICLVVEKVKDALTHTPSIGTRAHRVRETRVKVLYRVDCVARDF